MENKPLKNANSTPLKEARERSKLEQEQELIIKPQYNAKMSGNLTTLISQGFDDNKQLTIFNDNEGLSFYGERYDYKDKNTKLVAIYKQNLPINALTEETQKKFEQLIKDKVILSKDINTFTKKLFHLFHIYAFEEWHKKGYTQTNIDNILAKDLTIEIPKKDLLKWFNISRQYAENNTTTAIYTLKNIAIDEFVTKRRNKGVAVIGGTDIKTLFTNFDTTNTKKCSLTFSLQYAKYLFNYGFIQYPKTIFACKNSISFDILEYCYRYYFFDINHKPTFTISRGKLLENIKSISSFEDVEKMFNRKYKDKIYNPFEDALLYINDRFSDNIQIETIFSKEEMQEQDDHKEAKKSIDKNEWTKRKIRVTLFDAPNYRNKTSKKQKQSNQKEKQINWRGVDLFFFTSKFILCWVLFTSIFFMLLFVTLNESHQ